MIEAYNSPLRVEPLNAAHFPMLNASNFSNHSAWLQSIFFRSFLAGAEVRFPNVLEARNPFCLIAHEREVLVGIGIVQPYNLRGTCWSISFPETPSAARSCTQRNLYLTLLQKAFEIGKSQAKSWIVRCRATNTEQLAIARELGFQPLKLLQSWKPTTKVLNDSKKDFPYYLSNELRWEKITRKTAPMLLSLEQASLSGHLRQITDRQSKDLMDHNKPGSGILVATTGGTSAAIAAIMNVPGETPYKIFQLIRDVAWDDRITKAIPFIQNQLPLATNDFQLETHSEDESLTKLLENFGWERTKEEVLLGRSIWRRQGSTRHLKGTKSLESILGGFQPQQPQLPTPTLERR